MVSEQALLPELFLARGGGSEARLATPVLRLRGEDQDKTMEKLRYIHRNPVKRGLALEPDQWAWTSFRCYAHGESGPVLVNQQRRAELKMRKQESCGADTPAAAFDFRGACPERSRRMIA
jgi:hypothetical protein